MAPLFTGLRLGFGRSAEDAGGIILPAIGDSYQGGFFAGYISHTANSVATHLLIVAPAATGASGTGYTLTTMKQWKTSNTTTSGTTSDFDGSANSASMNNASHPAAQFCEGLSIDGYTDWYMPSRYEQDIAYQNLKPDTNSNDTSYGINPYSVPARASNRTSGAPARTSVAAFQSGGAEAFMLDAHPSSTEFAYNIAYPLVFSDGGLPTVFGKTDLKHVRAFRKVAL